MTNSSLSAGPTDLTLLKTIILGLMKKPFETSFRLTLQPSSRRKTKTPTDLVSDARSRRWIELPCGFLLLVLILRVGDQIKSWLHLPIPGSVLGLFILLICFRLQLLSPRLVEEASNRLLFILPALFIPIYVAGIGQGQFWSQVAGILLPALLVATASLWIFVGHLSQRFLSGSDE
jgi:holin-like protein